MSIIVNILTVAVGLAMIAIVFRLVVKKKMTEAQSVLWLAIGVAAIVLGMFPELIPWIADKLGIWYAPSVLLIATTIGLLLILFHNSIVLSGHTDKIHELAIQVALLKNENEELKKKIAKMECDFD